MFKSSDFDVDLLVTTINDHHKRVSMHGLREELLLAQAGVIGLPLHLIRLPESPSMEEYGEIMKTTVQHLQSEGYSWSGFGDIFLEDLREYRDQQLNQLGIQTHYPLWKESTQKLAQSFCDEGFKAVVVCVNGKLLDRSFAGREYDKSFINDLPDNVDPCGENGEFHTFCYDGPIFNTPVKFDIGETIQREYENENPDLATSFYFTDLVRTSV